MAVDGDDAPAAGVGTAAALPASGGTRWVVVAVVLLFLCGALLAVTLGALGMVLTSGPTPPPNPEPVSPEPVAQPEPIAAPVPEPPAPTPTVRVESTPEGAEVIENGQALCVTPCSIEHPDEAPIPRTLILRHRDHPDTTHEMTDPTVPQQVVLATKKPSPGPAPSKSPLDLTTER